jgi:hypothetical protein
MVWASRRPLRARRVAYSSVVRSRPREGHQDSAEAWRMRAGRVSQLVTLPRSVGQEIGNAELGRDVDREQDLDLGALGIML